MTIVAGYYRFDGAWGDDQIRRRLTTFAVQEDFQEVRRDLQRYEHGHIISIYGINGPLQPPPAEDVQGNLAALHGYAFNEADSITTDGLLKLVHARSHEAVQSLEGEFVAVVVDAVTHRVHLVNDRFAARAFYLYRDRDVVAFASSIPLLRHIIAQPLMPNPMGWAQMLTHAHTLGSTTTFSGVERLTPASHFVIDRRDVHHTCYWKPISRATKDVDPAAHATAVFEAFTEAVRQRAGLASNVYVPLSGGLDSRLIAGALPADSRCHLFTYNPSVDESESRELRVAREIAAILNLPHDIAPLSQPGRLHDLLDVVISGTGGQKPVHHVAGGGWPEEHLVANQLRLSGGPGDVLAGSYVKNTRYLDPAAKHACIQHFIRSYTYRLGAPIQLRGLLRKDFVRTLPRAVHDQLAASFRQTPGPTAAHVVTTWSMRWRQPNFTLLSGSDNEPHRATATPHLGYAYCDLMLQLPAHWLYGRNFYRFMIYRHLPQFRSVAYANDGKPLDGILKDFKSRSAPMQERLRHLIWAIEWAEARVGISLFDQWRSKSRKPRPNFHRQLLQEDKVLADRMTRWLHESAHAREILDVDGCRKFVHRFRHGVFAPRSPAGATETYGALATLCAADELLGT